MSSKRNKKKATTAETDTLKIVVIGESGVGKTCMIHTFLKGEFPSEYIATVMEPVKTTIKCGTVDQSIEIFDTPGQPEFTQNRVALYPNAHLILICCSIVEAIQFDKIDSWAAEASEHAPNAKFVLIGMKSDQRSDTTLISQIVHRTGRQPFPEFQGHAKAEGIGALAYIECSSLLNTGVRDVFSESCRLLLETTQTSGGCCNVM